MDMSGEDYFEKMQQRRDLHRVMAMMIMIMMMRTSRAELFRR